MFKSLKLYQRVLLFFVLIVFFISLFLIFILNQIKNDLIDNQKKELIKTTNLVKSMTNTVITVSIQNYLRGISETHLNTISFFYNQYKKGKISKTKALKNMEEILLSHKVGKTGYIHVLDISKDKDNITLAIHPELKGQNISHHNFTQEQAKIKKGYMEYEWEIAEDKFKTKSTFITYFKPYEWLINVAPYKDEFDQLIDFKPFLDELTKVQTSTKGSYITVFDTKGDVIFHPELTGKNALYIKDMKTGEYFLKNLVEKLEKDNIDISGWINYTYSQNGLEKGNESDKMLYYNYIPQHKWIVATVVNKEHILSPYNKLKNKLIIITIFLSISILMVLIYFSKYILNRLNNLTSAADQLSNNKYDISFHKAANDEIGDLEQAFEDAAKKITTLIDEQKKLNIGLEEEVEKRTKQLSNFIDSTTDFLWEIDAHGVYSYVSQGSIDILGYRPEEMIGKCPFSFMEEKQAKACKKLFKEAVKDRATLKDIVNWNISKDGKRVCLVTNGVPIFDKKGNYIGYRGADKDITSEKNNEYELIEFKNALFSNSKAVMLLIDPKDGSIVDCNNSALDYYKYSHKELTSMYIHEINQLTKDEIEEELRNADKEKRSHFYFKHILKNGDIKDVEVHSGPIWLKGKHLLYSIIHDITEQKQQEKIINEQAKLVSMGEMIANIAHQWRQPLSVISTGATGIKMQKEFGILKDEDLMKVCDKINDNAQYLSKTIDDFKNFIKGDRQKIEFNLKEDIDSFINLVEGSIKRHEINLIKDIPEDISLYGYPNELTQCFINIFNNAKDVLTEVDGERYIFITATKNKNEIIITFKDNGGGIPQDVLPHVFEPYFTTKHQSQGTGLGLCMTYNLIVDGMKGFIKAENENYTYQNANYTGAKFTIRLTI